MNRKALAIDPIRYDMYLHRLWAIGEEGRMTLQRVTASPIVSQGGECMSSFYDEKGTMVLACSGHLRFAAAPLRHSASSRHVQPTPGGRSRAPGHSDRWWRLN